MAHTSVLETAPDGLVYPPTVNPSLFWFSGSTLPCPRRKRAPVSERPAALSAFAESTTFGPRDVAGASERVRPPSNQTSEPTFRNSARLTPVTEVDVVDHDAAVAGERRLVRECDGRRPRRDVVRVGQSPCTSYGDGVVSAPDRARRIRVRGQYRERSSRGRQATFHRRRPLVEHLVLFVPPLGVEVVWASP